MKFILISLVIWMVAVTAYAVFDSVNNHFRDEILKSLVFPSIMVGR